MGLHTDSAESTEGGGIAESADNADNPEASYAIPPSAADSLCSRYFNLCSGMEMNKSSPWIGLMLGRQRPAGIRNSILFAPGKAI